MAGPETERLEIYVQPGESHLVRGPAILRTVLGSCVGITFWNRASRRSMSSDAKYAYGELKSNQNSIVAGIVGFSLF